MSLRAPAGTPLAVAAPPNGPIRLGIGRIGQTENLWCWVACFHMVLNGSGLSQCEIAQKAFPDRHCCDPNHSCNEALKPARIKDLWGKLGFADVVARSGHLEPGEIRTELGAGGPIEVWLGRRQENGEEFHGDGHVVLIVACEGTTRADMTLTIRDPNPRGGSTEVSYRGLLRNISYGPWVGTWTNIRR